jgi:pimeloyl-ACP methyl ester carboxylesterase
VTIAEAVNTRSLIALVACDASYKSLAEFTVGEVLAPHRDSAEGEEVDAPPIFDQIGREQWKYLRDPDTPILAIPGTGFSAVIFRKEGAPELIVALTGSNGWDSRDWWANLNLGMSQWRDERAGPTLVSYLVDNFEDWTIHFTGQSLGGALAQYAAHDYARALGERFNPGRVTLTTFNGLGASEGLKARYESDKAEPFNQFLPNVLSEVPTAHYVIANDLVSRLGGENLNESETYVLDFRKYGPGHAIQSHLGIVDAHRIESGFYRGFERYGSDFTKARKGYDLPNLKTESIQQIAAAFGNLLNKHTTSDKPGEATARIIAGVLGGILSANATDSIAFWNEIVDHLMRRRRAWMHRLRSSLRRRSII